MAFHKMAVVAPSGAGKTSLVAGLLRMGYKVRVFAFEDALDAITPFVEDRLLDNLSYTQFNDNVNVCSVEVGSDAKKSVMPTIKKNMAMEKLAFDSFVQAFGLRATDKVPPSEHTWYVYDSLSSMVTAMVNWCQIASGNLRWESRGAATGVFEMFIPAYITSTSIGANILILGHTKEVDNGEHRIAGLVGKDMPVAFARALNSVLSIDNSMTGRRSIMTAAAWPFTYLKCPFVGRVPSRIPATLTDAAGNVYEVGGNMHGRLYAADGLIRYIRGIVQPEDLPEIPDCLEAPLTTNAEAGEQPPTAVPAGATQAATSQSNTILDRIMGR